MAFDAPVAICRNTSNGMNCAGFENEAETHSPSEERAQPTDTYVWFGIDFHSTTPVGCQLFSAAVSLMGDCLALFKS